MEICQGNFSTPHELQYAPWIMHIVYILLFLVLVLVPVNFTHILQGCLTSTGAIIWLPQCQLSNPEGDK